MFFAASKLFWLLSKPSVSIVLIGTLGLVLLWLGRIAVAKWLLTFTILAAAAIVFLPVAGWLSAPLENRFQRPTPDHPTLDRPPDGIVYLGGTTLPVLTRRAGFPQVNAAAERLFETMRLARIYPEARIVVAAGSGNLFEQSLKEGDVVRQVFEAQDLPGMDRIAFDTRSRNTRENAVFAQELAKPDPGEVWLLVTSARHMPRAVGVFRRIGWPVIPWPVDYSDPGARGFDAVDAAVREWIGLIAYRIAGYTDSLLPGP